MSQIKVQNFGPIKAGFLENDGFLEIPKITVFTGSQGKSTISKLIAVFNSLENKLFTGELNEITAACSFIDIFCSYYTLENYFSSNTVLGYTGKIFDFLFEKSELNINRKVPDGVYRVDVAKYIPRKTIYVPAKRHLVSITNLLNRSLPLSDDTILELDCINPELYIIGSDYKIPFSEASSGWQAFIILLLIFEKSRFLKKPLIIIEKIEQNLSPTFQKKVLYKILGYINSNAGSLIITTHSPYILNGLILAIKAYGIKQNIIPLESCISEVDVTVYELSERGEIKAVPSYKGLPSDENYLNNLLAETNQLFDDLLAAESNILINSNSPT